MIPPRAGTDEEPTQRLFPLSVKPQTQRHSASYYDIKATQVRHVNRSAKAVPDTPERDHHPSQGHTRLGRLMCQTCQSPGGVEGRQCMDFQSCQIRI